MTSNSRESLYYNNNNVNNNNINIPISWKPTLR